MEEPSLTTFLTLRHVPTSAVSMMDRQLPSWTFPKMEIDEMRAKFLMETALPIATLSRTETADPSRANDRIESELPKQAKFSTLSELPIVILLHTEVDEPQRA